ncbi:MAG TPA: FCD domain-containing protein [Solirubrobacteraceae bacterium]|nr:FCD domain-containing protein [Solirubrobacteraceae bacterium]
MASESAARSAGPPSYGRELARLIIERCADPALAPGGRLPTERALASELGVTRTMIRHALSLLEADGRISREVGRGTFLRSAQAGRAPTPASGLAPASGDGLSQVGPADVMAVRRLIEPQVLPLAVAWATQRDFDELQRCLEGGAAAQNATEFEVWDLALHHALVVAGRNPLLLAMYAAVEEARRGEIWGNLKRRNDSRERRAAYQADHERIVAALRAREAGEAVRAMERHLERVQSNLLAPE